MPEHGDSSSLDDPKPDPRPLMHRDRPVMAVGAASTPIEPFEIIARTRARLRVPGAAVTRGCRNSKAEKL